MLYLMILHLRTVGANSSWCNSLLNSSSHLKDSDVWLTHYENLILPPPPRNNFISGHQLIYDPQILYFYATLFTMHLQWWWRVFRILFVDIHVRQFISGKHNELRENKFRIFLWWGNYCGLCYFTVVSRLSCSWEIYIFNLVARSVILLIAL